MALNNDISELIVMAREENEPNRYCHSDEYEKLYNKVEHKSLLIDEIEDKIGCPVEVRCKLYDGNYVYTKDGEKWIITFNDETHFIAVYSKATSHDRKFTYSDYKIAWWLKPDKSK